MCIEEAVRLEDKVVDEALVAEGPALVGSIEDLFEDNPVLEEFTEEVTARLSASTSLEAATLDLAEKVPDLEKLVVVLVVDEEVENGVAVVADVVGSVDTRLHNLV